MNTKMLITFIFGVAVGAVGSYFITKEAVKTKTQLEINEMREYYKEQYGGIKKETKNDNGELVTTGEDGKDIYTKIDMVAQDYHTESDIVADEKDKVAKTIKTQYQKPYEITEDEYLNDKKWAHMEYNWYYHQKVMMDMTPETGEPAVIDDPYVQVGAELLETLEESGDGIIYVRNDNRGELYFITLCAGDPPIDPETYSSPILDDDEDVYD